MLSELSSATVQGKKRHFKMTRTQKLPYLRDNSKASFQTSNLQISYLHCVKGIKTLVTLEKYLVTTDNHTKQLLYGSCLALGLIWSHGPLNQKKVIRNIYTYPKFRKRIRKKNKLVSRQKVQDRSLKSTIFYLVLLLSMTWHMLKNKLLKMH